jgi:hypothetical protein
MLHVLATTAHCCPDAASHSDSAAEPFTCDAFGVFGAALPEKSVAFHSNCLEMVPI